MALITHNRSQKSSNGRSKHMHLMGEIGCQSLKKSFASYEKIGLEKMMSVYRSYLKSAGLLISISKVWTLTYNLMVFIGMDLIGHLMRSDRLI